MGKVARRRYAVASTAAKKRSKRATEAKAETGPAARAAVQTRAVLHAAFAESKHLASLVAKAASTAHCLAAECNTIGLPVAASSAVLTSTAAHVRARLNIVLAMGFKIAAQLRLAEQALRRLIEHYKRIAEQSEAESDNSAGGGAGGSGDAAWYNYPPDDDNDPERIARALEHPCFGIIFAACIECQKDCLGAALPRADTDRMREQVCEALRANAVAHAAVLSMPWLLKYAFILVEEFKTERQSLYLRAADPSTSATESSSTDSDFADSATSSSTGE